MERIRLAVVPVLLPGRPQALLIELLLLLILVALVFGREAVIDLVGLAIYIGIFVLVIGLLLVLLQVLGVAVLS